MRDMSEPHPEHKDLRLVAWTRGGSLSLRVGKRHVATVDAVEGRAARVTLCGRSWKRSGEVMPTDYWTDGDCQRCVRIVGLRALVKET